MSITSYVTLNGETLYPELPIERTTTPVVDELLMANGNLRRYRRKDRRAWSLRLRGATEAEHTTWMSAAATSSSVTYIDEDGVSFTVAVDSVSDTLAATRPSGGTATPTYDIEIQLTEV